MSGLFTDPPGTLTIDRFAVPREFAIGPTELERSADALALLILAAAEEEPCDS